MFSISYKIFVTKQPFWTTVLSMLEHKMDFTLVQAFACCQTSLSIDRYKHSCAANILQNTQTADGAYLPFTLARCGFNIQNVFLSKIFIFYYVSILYYNNVELEQLLLALHTAHSLKNTFQLSSKSLANSTPIKTAAVEGKARISIGKTPRYNAFGPSVAIISRKTLRMPCL